MIFHNFLHNNLECYSNFKNVEILTINGPHHETTLLKDNSSFNK